MKTKFTFTLLLFTLLTQLGRSQIKKEFCGWNSTQNNFTMSPSFSKISKCTINYYIKNGVSGISSADIAKEIAKAFEQWSNVTDLKFVETNFETGADIIFSWTNQGDTVVAAEAFPGTPIGIEFNSNAKWVANTMPPTNMGTYNIYRVAVHEIGHTLGLGHSASGTAIMFPKMTSSITLNNDDIAGIQSLYGVKTGPIVGPEHLCVGSTATYFSTTASNWVATGGIEIISYRDKNWVIVQAVNDMPGELSTSTCESITIYTTVSQPGSILGLSKICPVDKAGVFSVNPVPGATAYIWSASDPSVVVGSNGTICNVSNITKPFTLSVRAKNPCGISAATTKYISIKTTSGGPCNGDDNLHAIENISNNNLAEKKSEIFEVNLYPNPSSGNLKFQFSEEYEHVAISIYNMTGAKLFSKQLKGKNTSIDVSSLPKGYYMALIDNGKTTIRKTFMRN